MKSIMDRFKRAPISHGAAALCFAYGAWMLGINGWHYYHGHEVLTMTEFLVHGPGSFVAGLVFWSEAGTLVDIALGFAEKKVEDE